MFVKKTVFKDQIEYMSRDIKRLEERYWELWHKHEILLSHFGLTEHTIPQKTELRTKGGPERGD
jgi:hypothetical protein